MIGDTKGKTVLFIILIIVALALAGGVFYLYQQEHARNVAINQQLDETSAKFKVAESNLSEAKDSIADLEQKLKSANSQIDALTENLQKEKVAREENLAQIEKMKIDFEQQIKMRQDLEGRLSQAQTAAKDAAAKLKDLESQKTDLENKVKDLEAKAQAPAGGEGVELGKIVVGPEGAAQSAAVAAPQTAGTEQPAQGVKAALEGKILVVNKEYNFAVMNLGVKSGIKVGDIFSVLRGNEYIGDLKVEKVHDSMSAAGFVPPDVKDKINEGDRVVQKI
jgi:septal ring factor EnvC (AmiA/AmiB activator)